jgi:hypothetical protein
MNAKIKDEIRRVIIATTKNGVVLTKSDVNDLTNEIAYLVGNNKDEYAEKPAWIRKESKLPLPNVKVLVTDGYKIGRGFYTGYKNQWAYQFFGDGWIDDKKITHWMPLPELPGDVPKQGVNFEDIFDNFKGNKMKTDTPYFLETLIQKCIDEGVKDCTEARIKANTPGILLSPYIKAHLLSELPKHFELTLKEQELLPCPFCGGRGDAAKDAYWSVRCDDCECESGWFESKEEAIEAWNKRK